MQKGYIQIYTGDGKGKTTAALGLSLRAVCANKSVFFAQFLKGQDYAELKAIDILPNFTLKQYGSENFIINKASKQDVELAQKGLKEIKSIILKGEYDIIVLDELNMAIYFKLITVEEIIEILDNRNPNSEIIITGRNAPEALINYADLVSEIKAIKHYYNKGVLARKGIEY